LEIALTKETNGKLFIENMATSLKLNQNCVSIKSSEKNENTRKKIRIYGK
jgi:hypothetical protein